MKIARDALLIKGDIISVEKREDTISMILDLKKNLEAISDSLKSDEEIKNLTAELGNKVLELENFSYSKKQFSYIIDLYISSLKEAKLGIFKEEKVIRKLKKLDKKYTDPSRNNFIKFFEEAKSIHGKALSHLSQDKIDKHLVSILNKNPKAWHVVQYTINYMDCLGTTHDFTSKIIPLSESEIVDYLSKEGVRGITSFDRESEHIINAHTTLLECDGQIVFKGMRHGCTNDKESRVQEMLQMAIFEQVGKEAFDEIENGEVIDLNLCSTQLLTHTIIAGDGDMGLNQIRLLQQYGIDAKPEGVNFELNLPNGEKKTVTLKLHLLTFNFGVNMQTRMKLGRSGNEDDINANNLKKMLGNKFLSSKSKLPGGELVRRLETLAQEINNTQNNTEREELQREEKILRDLANQIRDLWRTGDYRAADKDPYAMPARVAYIAYRLGFVSSFNCKSGKDRTGILDAEIKNLAAYIKVNKQVPDLDKKLTKIDIKNLTKMHKFCGSNEIILWCIGVMGSKIPNMKGVNKRFSDGDYSKKGEGDFRGMAAYVSIIDS